MTDDAQEFIPLKPITIGDLRAEIGRLRAEWNGDAALTAYLDAAERELNRICEERERAT